MKHWDFYDWATLVLIVAAIAVFVGVLLPILIVMAKESWMWMFSVM